MTTPLPPRILAATLELAQADLRVYDLTASVRGLASRGVNAFVVFGIGYLGGEAYYPSHVAPHHPQLGDRDFLSEACAATAATDTACIAYVNSLFGGPDAWQEHPEWVQRRTDGLPTAMGDARAMCPLSPYGDRIVAAVAEIASAYPVAGLYLDEPSFQSWCACENCASAFAIATAKAIPQVADSSDQAWAEFVAWRYEAIAAFIERAGAAFHAERPDGAFWCQHAFPMTSTATPSLRATFQGALPARVPRAAEAWSRTLFYGQRLEAQLPSLDVLSAELWRRFGDRPIWWPGAATSYMRSVAGDRRVLPFLEYPDFPWSLRPIATDELAYIVADVRANGGDPWCPLYAPGRADESAWDTLGAVNLEVADALEGCGSPCADVAVGYSPSSADHASDVDVRSYLDGFTGMLELLHERHVAHRVISLEVLGREALDGVALLVIPAPVVLSDESIDRVRDFAAGGGLVVLTGFAGLRRQVGAEVDASLARELTGGSYDDEVDLGIAYLDWVADEGVGDGAFAVRGTVREATPIDATVLATVAHGFELFEAPVVGTPPLAAVMQAKRGRGFVTTTTLDIGALARHPRAPRVGELLDRLLTDAGYRSQLHIEAPATVSAVPWRSPRGWTIVLLNRTGIEETGHVIPVGPLTIAVPRQDESSRAELRVTGEAQGSLAREGVYWRIDVPALEVWAVVQIAEEAE